MPYKLVEGEVRLFYRNKETSRLVGSRPDGDSAWFKPDNPNLLLNIGNRSAEFNKGDFAQLRFEGIDALELHFPGSAHQLEDHAVGARDSLLGHLGFSPGTIEYAPNDDIPTSVRSSKPVAVRAHILTRAIDPFGRPVSFVFPGNAKEYSGTDLFLDTKRLDKSLNAMLMREGNVYPGFYTAREVNGERVGGLPGDLREHLANLAIQAFNDNDGVWADDESTRGFQIRKKEDLSELAIWPKLYRRLAKYFDDTTADHTNLHGFRNWLLADRSSRDDLIFVLPIGEKLNLSDILTITPTTIRMNFEPEDLLIIPR